MRAHVSTGKLQARFGTLSTGRARRLLVWRGSFGSLRLGGLLVWRGSLGRLGRLLLWSLLWRGSLFVILGLLVSLGCWSCCWPLHRIGARHAGEQLLSPVLCKLEVPIRLESPLVLCPIGAGGLRMWSR